MKKILILIIALMLTISLVSASDFNIYNKTDESQIYFAVNGTTGNIGLGVSNPTTLLQLLNNKWISALNNLSNGVVNMFKVNERDEIEVGATLNIGSFEFAEDSGLVTLVDMPVSSTPSAGTSESYVFKVDGDNIMTVYSEADGSGGVQNKRVGIGTTTPGETLVVIGNVNISGTLNVSGRIAFPNLANCDTIDTDANGVLTCGVDSGGSFDVQNSTSFNRSGTNVFLANIGDNVGIGTSNPSSTLEVDGTFNASSSGSSLRVDSNGDIKIGI